MKNRTRAIVCCLSFAFLATTQQAFAGSQGADVAGATSRNINLTILPPWDQVRFAFSLLDSAGISPTGKINLDLGRLHDSMAKFNVSATTPLEKLAGNTILGTAFHPNEFLSLITDLSQISPEKYPHLGAQAASTLTTLHSHADAKAVLEKTVSRFELDVPASLHAAFDAAGLAKIDQLGDATVSVQHSQDPFLWLSMAEKKQLGQLKISQNGRRSIHRYASRWEWSKLRQMFLERSLTSNPRLNPQMTAYTPGETLHLLQQPEVASWHEKMKSFIVPEWAKFIVFVPCAMTKPWIMPYAKKSALYRAYNEIRELVKARKAPPAYFVTVSEPLGVVPEDYWGNFPQYDNPGLFRDDGMRAGFMTTRDWKNSTFKKELIVPFDPGAYKRAVNSLGGVIADFIQNNRRSDRHFLSFVETADGASSHSDMLDRANGKLVQRGEPPLAPESRFPRRPAPRQSPKDLILEKLAAVQSARNDHAH